MLLLQLLIEVNLEGGGEGMVGQRNTGGLEVVEEVPLGRLITEVDGREDDVGDEKLGGLP